jgi:hypothetical protein
MTYGVTMDEFGRRALIPKCPKCETRHPVGNRCPSACRVCARKHWPNERHVGSPSDWNDGWRDIVPRSEWESYSIEAEAEPTPPAPKDPEAERRRDEAAEAARRRQAEAQAEIERAYLRQRAPR